MRLTAKIKLLPTPDQQRALQQTLETANAACNTISQSAWATKTFRQFDIHRLCYADTRDAFGLSAQMTVRCIAKVADAYKRDRGTQRVFKAHGAIAYDDRILSWNMAALSVSIWTMHGRQSIPFVCGPRQWELLQTQRGETDLALVAGQWYLLAACEIEEPTPADVEDALGVDLGIVNLATDSDGETHSGAQVETVGTPPLPTITPRRIFVIGLPSISLWCPPFGVRRKPNSFSVGYLTFIVLSTE